MSFAPNIKRFFRTRLVSALTQAMIEDTLSDFQSQHILRLKPGSRCIMKCKGCLSWTSAGLQLLVKSISFWLHPVFVWCMKVLWQSPIVQPLTSYHLFPALLSQLLLPSHLYLTNGNVVLRSDFWTFDRLKDLLIKSFSNQCCEITQFRWPHCRVMIRRFIAVEFCNKRLQCVVFYESHLAIIKWENCSRQGLLYDDWGYTGYVFCVGQPWIGLSSWSYNIIVMTLQIIFTWCCLLWYDGSVGLFLKYRVVVVQISHLCKW